MNFFIDLSAFYADFGEPVSVAGSSITAIWSSGYTGVLDASSSAPTLRCRSTDVSSVAVGSPVIRAGVNYTLRGKETIFPDELETILILERA